MAKGRDPERAKLAKLLGERFRRYRQDKGLSQAELAERADVDIKTVSNTELGVWGRWPSEDVFERMMEALRVPRAQRQEDLRLLLGLQQTSGRAREMIMAAGGNYLRLVPAKKGQGDWTVQLGFAKPMDVVYLREALNTLIAGWNDFPSPLAAQSDRDILLAQLKVHLGGWATMVRDEMRLRGAR